MIHGYLVPLVGIIHLFYVSVSLINEKKNHMIDYLRTMGLLVRMMNGIDLQESANIISYIVIYGVFTLIPSILYEISGRLLGITQVSSTSIGVRILITYYFQIPSLWLFCYMFCVTCMGVFILYFIIIYFIIVLLLFVLLVWLLLLESFQFFLWLTIVLSPVGYRIVDLERIQMLVFQASFIIFLILLFLLCAVWQSFTIGLVRTDPFLGAILPRWFPDQMVMLKGQEQNCDIRIRFTYNFKSFLAAFVWFSFLAWYYSYRSMCHKQCCFILSPSFWNPTFAVKIE